MPDIKLYNQWKSIPYFFKCGHSVRDIEVEMLGLFIERFKIDDCDINYLDIDITVLGFKITTRWFYNEVH